MKGIIFNLLEEIVVRDHGEDAWDLLLDRAGVDGIYTSLGSYADADLGALMNATAETVGQPTDDAVRWFGRNTTPLLRVRYPDFFTWHTDVRGFVLSVNEIIHPEVRKLYPGAGTPSFGFDDSHPDRLVLDYRSERRLCMFAEGLLLGAGDVYAEELSIHQPVCMRRGDDRCQIEISFKR